MESCCDLEVDVNGEEIFMVDKKLVASFSGKFSKLFNKLKGSTTNLKVILHDFPGGAEGFELMARFCYNNGRTEITPLNAVLLNCAAHFMEMDKNICAKSNLADLTEECLEGMSSWTWSELIVALKQCQDLLPAISSSSILQKFLDCLIGKLAVPTGSSPCTCCSDNFSFQFSCDTSSSFSARESCCQTTQWFEDLMFVDTDLIGKLVKSMVSQNFDSATIYKFLFHYRKSRSIGASFAEKRNITEAVIKLLCLLNRSVLHWRGLFDIYQAALRLKMSKHYKKRLESMIGSQLDKATLDHLLVRSPHGKGYMYDVSLVIRLAKVFLLDNSWWLSPSRLKKVASLIDSYIAEVAPDTHLRPSKFAALIMVLPNSARRSHDHIYRAIDTYLEVHGGLSEEEKMRVCCALNCEKLSAEASKHHAQNSKFPPRIAVQAFIYEQAKVKDSCQHHILTMESLQSAKQNSGEKVAKKQVLLCAEKLNLATETKEIEAQMEEMQCRVLELEKVCSIMNTQIGQIMKRRFFLPKLCS